MERKIWFCWFQGLDNAPELIRINLKSWRERNPTWEIVVLDNSNISNFVNLEAILGENIEFISPASMSDVLRVNLLEKYGGVWVDATTFCNTALDEWLYESMYEGFFGLKNGSNDRIVSTFFIACEAKHPLISAWKKETNLYWKNIFRNQVKYSHVRRDLERSLSVSHLKAQNWLSRIVVNELKIYPYFWFHYLFYQILNTQVGLREFFDKCKNEFSGKVSGFLREESLNVSSNPRISKILNNGAPFFKFDHRLFEQQNSYDSAINYLHNQLLKESIVVNEIEKVKHPYGPNGNGIQVCPIYKFFFVHIPKCGGTSIDESELFSNVYFGKRFGHATYDEIKEKIKNVEGREASYRGFSLVRNPWDRLVSAFYYLNNGGSNEGDARVYETYLKKFNGNFSLFLDEFVAEPSKFLNLLHFKPMSHFLPLKSVDIPFFVQKLEKISDKSNLEEFLGVKFEMPHVRKNSEQGPLFDYDQRNFDAIKRIYSEDIENFGYGSFAISNIKNYKREDVLVLGDSHVRVFNNVSFSNSLPRTRFLVENVGGATISGLENPNSKTQAMKIFKRKLEVFKGERVILCLGEVDLGFVLWLKSDGNNTLLKDLFNRTIKRYIDFMIEVKRNFELIVISAPLPTISDGAPVGEIANARKEIKASQVERTELTVRFNNAIESKCYELGIDYLNLDSSSLGADGLVCQELLNSNLTDHHYNESQYANLLIKHLSDSKFFDKV